ncbi:hypothetical protein J2751_003004 [Halorubrum alkaliphilum]|uniref:Uncharacterized protein n=1 Tax=Halorubrum alkaliphilum TaxID=261290 RepID=A0A8T4GI40_9EURY|nr:hypothetical protein [Halorubrum alkaliphilum]MBP1923956.1 hypothetical protein [Halorubrum alkaliphilum]
MDPEHTVERRSEADDGLAIDPVHVLGLTVLIVALAALIALIATGVAFGGTVTTGVSGTPAVVAYTR